MTILYVIVAILIFGFLIAIHEFGHFIVAKACNVKVNEFSIGMGPLLFSRQKGETLYSLRLLPIGGFCAMEGEDGDSDDDRAFSKAAGWKRFLILIAGAAFNFITCLVIVLALFSGSVAYTEPVITDFMEGCPLESEELLQAGDELYAINGKRILLYGDFSTILMVENTNVVDLTVRRDGELITFKDLNLELREYEEDGETVLRYGLYFDRHVASPGEKLKLSLYTSVNFLRNVFWSFQMLANGAAGVKDLSGPVGIVQQMSEVGNAAPTIWDGLMNIFYFGAFVAANLAVMNLLPIPALDGGRIFFLLLNGLSLLILKKRIPERLEGTFHMIGMVLLLALIGLVMIQDVVKIFT